MIYNQLNLCSAALLQIGSNSISSFQESSTESEIAGNIYPIIRDGLLSSYPWSFAISQSHLGRIDTTPIADFNYAYLLPTDFLRIISPLLHLGHFIPILFMIGFVVLHSG